MIKILLLINFMLCNFEILGINRSIDLFDKYPAEHITLKIKNKKVKTNNTFRFYYRKNLARNLKYTDVYDSDYNKIEFKEVNCNKYYCIDIYLKDMVKKETFEFQIKNIYEGIYDFLPHKIKINEDNLIYFKDYFILTKKNIPKVYSVTLNAKSMPKSYSPLLKTKSVNNNFYSFHYETQNYKKLYKKKFFIHITQNMAFEKFYDVQRIINVSHFGFIKVNEKFNLTNNCAKLDGEFNRFDFDNAQFNKGTNILRYVNSILPYDTWDLNLRDENGNISTSMVKKVQNRTDFLIKPRFPLFGNWNTTLFIDYNIDSINYLSHSKENNLFKLDIPFSYSIKDILTDQYTLKVILPEHSKLKHINMPYKYKNKYETINYQVLDLIGRKEIVFEFKSVYPEYFKENITIYYELENIFNNFKMIYCIIFIFFVTSIVFISQRVKFDFKSN